MDEKEFDPLLDEIDSEFTSKKKSAAHDDDEPIDDFSEDSDDILSDMSFSDIDADEY